MSLHSAALITPEQYLEIERKAEYKSEYYQGVIYAMAGGTLMHGVIIANLTAALVQALRKRNCVVCPVDVRLRVTPTGLYTYPDIMVVCGEPAYCDDRKDMVTNPVLIVEVLSPSTEAHDRGFKLAHYRKLDSMQEYMLVSQHERRIERYLRQPNDQWLYSESTGGDASMRMESVGSSLALAEIYDKVEFEAYSK
jgi:Uma2 family endonuclease